MISIFGFAKNTIPKKIRLLTEIKELSENELVKCAHVQYPTQTPD
jgi:hypothetical protein